MTHHGNARFGSSGIANGLADLALILLIALGVWACFGGLIWTIGYYDSHHHGEQKGPAHVHAQ